MPVLTLLGLRREVTLHRVPAEARKNRYFDLLVTDRRGSSPQAGGVPCP